MQSTAYGRGTSASAQRAPATRAKPAAAHGNEDKPMETDDLAALLRRDSEGVSQRISDLDAHLGERMDLVDKRIDDVGTHLGERIVDNNKRLDDLRTRLGERIDDTNRRIDDLGAHLGERIVDTNARLDRFDKRFEQVDKRFEQVDKRFDELVAHLRAFEQRLFDHVQSVQTELGRRIDAVQQFRLQGVALVVALTATSAIVGTFALQLLTAF